MSNEKSNTTSEWNKAEFVKALRAREEAYKELSDVERAYLEALDSQVSSEHAATIKKLTSLFKKQYEQAEIESELRKLLSTLAERRASRVTPSRQRRLEGAGLFRRSDQVLMAALKLYDEQQAKKAVEDAAVETSAK